MSLEEIERKLKEGRCVCLSCGYSGDDIQGDKPNLYRGYGCPECHSPLTVVMEEKEE